MFIQELAKRPGVPARTIRYYESIGLLPAPERAENNYCRYTPEALERLRFIVSARSLGFALADSGEFLSAREPGTCDLNPGTKANIAKRRPASAGRRFRVKP